MHMANRACIILMHIASLSLIHIANLAGVAGISLIHMANLACIS